MDVIMKGMKQFPTSEIIAEDANEIRQKFLSSLKENDQLSVPIDKETSTEKPMKIRGEQATDLIRPVRQTAIERLIEDEFFLKTADFSKPEHVRLTLERISDKYSFSADVPLGVLDPDQIESLKDNSWGQVNVEMKILVKELHGKYTSAKVISVES